MSGPEPPPRAPFHLWSRQPLGPGVLGARTYCGLGYRSWLFYEAGVGRSRAYQRSDGPSPQWASFPPGPKGFSLTKMITYILKQETNCFCLKGKENKNTAGRTPECAGGQRPPCLPVVGVVASQGSQSHGWTWPSRWCQGGCGDSPGRPCSGGWASASSVLVSGG